jgi:hypothetical protein
MSTEQDKKPQPRRPPSPRPGPSAIRNVCARGTGRVTLGGTRFACCAECDRGKCIYAK